MEQSDTNKVVAYYGVFGEQDRLASSWGQIEFIRTQDIIQRYLRAAPAVVLDVGGAAGRYSCWLAQMGYEVHLVDPVPLHVAQASKASDAQPESPIISCTVGDARQLEFEDGVADAVLLLGPLYHLLDVAARHQALLEAYRVLKSGGVLFAVGISKFASTIDGLDSGYFQDPVFRDIMRQDLATGQHRNPTDNSAYFMDTFFHHPAELQAEVTKAGFGEVELLAVEGISYMMQDFDANWQLDDSREFLLEIISEIEKEPSLIGASPHIMCVAVRP